MKTLEQAFSERARLYERVEAEARTVLNDFCVSNGFTLMGRAKALESLKDKLETGRYADLSSIDDAIAFSIVIDTVDQEDRVKKFLKKIFDVVVVRSGNTLQDERLFDFDSTRAYCRLTDRLQTGVGAVVFEVQIRTMLQHAWSKITHPLVYKAKVYDPRAGRLAAELMAQLEAADRTFSRFVAVSKTVKAVSRYDVIASKSLTAMIDGLVADGTIPSEMRPTNGRRLGENLLSAVHRNHRKDVTVASETIQDFFRPQAAHFPRSVSLFQLAIVALHDAKLLEHGSKTRPRRYYVTDELISLFPQAADIPNRITIE